MHVIMTRVQLKPDSIDDVRRLFEETNPALVSEQPNWIKAAFTANRETNQVTVLAFWRNADSYQIFSKSQQFQQTMSQFGQFFAGPPDVTINEVLFEM